MKKVLFLTLLVTLSSIHVMAQENILYNFNTGNVGLGGNFLFNTKEKFEASVSVANFGVESPQTGLGIEFSPFYAYWLIDNNNEREEYSFVNVNIFWNLFNIDTYFGNFFFGPFAAANYLFLDNGVHWDRYIVTAGIQMGFRTSVGNFNYKIFSLEFGYRNINGAHSYHVCGKVDLITLLFAYILSN